MKNKMKEMRKKNAADIEEKKMSRKEAIKKTGYIAASAATMMILLGSPKAQACSPTPHCDPPKPKHGGGGGGHHDSPWN